MWKKILAPVLITAVILFFFMGYLILCLVVDFPILVKAIGVLVLLSLMGVGIYVLIQRIQEIRSGVEDDLSQY